MQERTQKMDKSIKNGIIGFVVGDVLGVPVEFMTREELRKNPVVDLREYGTYNQPLGSWSDDTSMTLATMDSIIHKEEIDTTDIGNRFLNQYRKNEYTPLGKVFDIGRTTIQALAKYELKLVEKSLTTNEDEIIKTYELVNKFKTQGKKISVKEYLDYDADGQAEVVLTRLLSVE